MLDRIQKSSEILYYRTLLTYPLEFFKARLGLGHTNFSPIYQKALFDRKIATCGVFVAAKDEL